MSETEGPGVPIDPIKREIVVGFVLEGHETDEEAMAELHERLSAAGLVTGDDHRHFVVRNEDDLSPIDVAYHDVEEES